MIGARHFLKPSDVLIPTRNVVGPPREYSITVGRHPCRRCACCVWISRDGHPSHHRYRLVGIMPRLRWSRPQGRHCTNQPRGYSAMVTRSKFVALVLAATLNIVSAPLPTQASAANHGVDWAYGNTTSAQHADRRNAQA